MSKKFQIIMEVNETLDIDDIWPDGDAPENPTVKDVLNVIEVCGGPRDILRDWFLDDYLTLDVYEVKGKD